MLLRTRCFLAGSTHFCKTVRLDFGFCSDSAGLVFGNCFLAGAAERTESLEPQVTTFWYHKVLQAPAKCFHRRRTNLGRHLLQSLGKTRTGMFHAGPCHAMPSSNGALPDRSGFTKARPAQSLCPYWWNLSCDLTCIGQPAASPGRLLTLSCQALIHVSQTDLPLPGAMPFCVFAKGA